MMSSSTESRRAARLWLEAANRKHDALRQAARRPEVEHLAAQLLRARDRPRARYALRGLLDPHADFAVELRRPAVLLWRTLRPGMRLHAAPAAEHERQAYVGVIALALGQVRPEPGRMVVAADGLWGLALAHHAIGRLFERSPGTDATSAILAAHRTVIAGCRSHAVAERTKLLVPAGPAGVFVGRLVRATFHGQPAGLLVLGETYVPTEMLYRDQEDMLLPPASDRDTALAVLPLPMILS